MRKRSWLSTWPKKRVLFSSALAARELCRGGGEVFPSHTHLVYVRAHAHGPLLRATDRLAGTRGGISLKQPKLSGVALSGRPGANAGCAHFQYRELLYNFAHGSEPIYAPPFLPRDVLRTCIIRAAS